MTKFEQLNAKDATALLCKMVEIITSNGSRGIREFCFYEDNLLLGRDNFINLLHLIADDPELRGIQLHAPEGIEVRLLHRDVTELMRRAGFEKIYFPLETINAKMQKEWQRTHHR